MNDDVILVDANDSVLGLKPKLEAHVDGSLHRAISCFLFSTPERVLLQRRALGKYHSGGLWANSCCSHPTQEESNIACAHRRLLEELGVHATLREFGTIVYRCIVPPSLIEHEFVHGFVGQFDGILSPCADEVSETRWSTIEEIENMANEKNSLSPWLLEYLRSGFLLKAFDASREVF